MTEVLAPTRQVTGNRVIRVNVRCPLCLEEAQARGAPPGQYDHLEIGLTEIGIQAWCRLHQKNVLNVDLQGARPPARVGP